MKKLLSMKEVQALTSLSRPTINRGREDGTFPEPLEYGWRLMFPEEEIEKWIDQRLKERDALPPRQRTGRKRPKKAKLRLVKADN